MDPASRGLLRSTDRFLARVSPVLAVLLFAWGVVSWIGEAGTRMILSQFLVAALMVVTWFTAHVRRRADKFPEERR